MKQQIAKSQDVKCMSWKLLVLKWQNKMIVIIWSISNLKVKASGSLEDKTSKDKFSMICGISNLYTLKTKIC